MVYIIKYYTVISLDEDNDVYKLYYCIFYINSNNSDNN